MSTEWMKQHLLYESRAWDSIEAGEELPSEVRAIDATLVVAGAIASRDFYPVHHDKPFAEQAGSPDIFLNILTTNGLMAAFVGNWCGPDWDLASIDLRLKIPAFPGQELTMTGSVTGKSEEGGSRAVEVAFAAATEYGTHCEGTATIRQTAGT